MAVKIIGGACRGFSLATPRSDTTKPTSVLVKRKLFDWRQNLEGMIFVDLCAGSGAMGFEALSRGAEKIILNDSMKGAFLTMKDNREAMVKAFKFDASRITITNIDAIHWVKKEMSYQLTDTEDVILYLDPPYENHVLYMDLLKHLTEAGFAGQIWLESDKLKGPKAENLTGAFRSVIKTVDHGDHFVVVGKLI